MSHRATSRVRRRSPWLLAALAGLGLAAALPSGASAEPDPPSLQNTDMLAAHAVVRVALMDLRDVGTPTKRDFKVAEELFAVAAGLLPDDQTILRLYMEAASEADDSATVGSIARRLVKLDPSDTVAQLRVISAGISAMQTADERLAAYDKFLGDAGSGFDDSVRSRLALDAALLYRERGDLGAFRSRLAKAVELDPTNKDAAALVLTFFQPAPGDPTGRLDAMFYVLFADPCDAQIYSAITGELLARGANVGALRFAKLEQRLCAIQRRPVPTADDFLYDLAEWNVAGPEAVLRRLGGALIEARQAAKERAGTVSPADVHLPIERERSRVLCAAALGDTRRCEEFLSEYAAIIDLAAKNAADPGKRARGVSEAQAMGPIRSQRAELAWLRLLAGVQTDAARASIEDLRKSGALDAPTLSRFDAWLSLRAGSIAEGERALAGLSASDPLAALGAAVAAELRHDRPTAITRYGDLARRDTGDFIASFAATRYEQVAGDRLHPDDTVRRVEADAAAVPNWLEAMVDNPRRMMSLEVKPITANIIPTDRTPVRLTLRNMSPIPLAVGPDKPMCSRFLFAPSVNIGQQSMPTADLVWVANLDRRLRLRKDESVDMIVWPDLGALSSYMEMDLPEQAQIRWWVLQGFVVSGERLYDAAPQMLTVDVSPLLRRMPYRTDAVFEALRGGLETGSPRELADTILSIKRKYAMQMVGVSPPPLSDAETDRLLEVLARRFGAGQLTKAAKILVLCLTPSRASMPMSLPVVLRLEQVAAQETDEDILVVDLATHVVQPTDGLLSAPNVLKSARLGSLAKVIQDRLQEKVPTQAVTRLSVSQLSGMVPPSAPSPDGSTPARSAYTRPLFPANAPDPNPIPVIP